MAKIKKFTEQEDLHYKVGFELTRKEVILLLKLLDDLKDRRSEAELRIQIEGTCFYFNIFQVRTVIL